jgi:hypothetical protein
MRARTLRPSFKCSIIMVINWLVYNKRLGKFAPDDPRNAIRLRPNYDAFICACCHVVRSHFYSISSRIACNRLISAVKRARSWLSAVCARSAIRLYIRSCMRCFMLHRLERQGHGNRKAQSGNCRGYQSGECGKS